MKKINMTICLFIFCVFSSWSITVDEAKEILFHKSALIKSMQFLYERNLYAVNNQDEKDCSLIKNMVAIHRYQDPCRFYVEIETNGEPSLNLYYDGKTAYRARRDFVSNFDDIEINRQRYGNIDSRTNPRWIMDEILNGLPLDEFLRDSAKISIESETESIVLTGLALSHYQVRISLDPKKVYSITKIEIISIKDGFAHLTGRVDEFKEITVDGEKLYIPIKMALLSYLLGQLYICALKFRHKSNYPLYLSIQTQTPHLS